MGDNVYKKAIENLSGFFDVQLQYDPFGAGIFEPLRKIIDFDQCYIFFFNPNSIKLKYLFGKDRTYSINKEFKIDDNVKKELFISSNLILNQQNEIIKLLKINDFRSFITSKLIIKNAVFGVVLMCKKEESFYNKDDLKVVTSIGTIVSYKIKDIELSEIFKVQLQALKDSIVQSKDSYKTIKEQNVKIIESDKVKNEFLANISHELRTPLNAIIGFSESLANQLFGDLNTKQLEYVNDIHLSGIQLLEMINEILDLSKIESRAMTLNRSEVLISQAINEVVNIVKPLVDKKNIKVSTNIVKEEKVFVDFQKIRQILYNLLSNAIKFSNEKEEIQINVKFDRKNFTLAVKDNGIGIAPKDQERIFDKFVQLENAYTKRESSTGLGLTITKELVEMHKGNISVKSKIGKGAAFTVTIPIGTK